MIDLGSVSSVGSAGLAFGGMILAFFWKGDEAVSAEFKKWLCGSLKGLEAPQFDRRLPQAFGQVFDRTFGADPLSFRFIARSMILSAAAIVIFSATYLVMHPAFWRSILDDPFQRQQVLRQMLTIALAVNFVVDFLCLAYCRDVVFQMTRKPIQQRIPIYLIKDLLIKSLIFVVAMTFVYMVFATSAGSFGGDVASAAAALPRTLWDGLRFANLSAVYLYSSLVSSFWLWGYLGCWLLFGAAAGLPRLLAVAKWALPLDQYPIRSLGLVASLLGSIGYWAIVVPQQV